MTTLTAPTAQVGPTRLALWGALGIVYVVWGSTYLAIRVVVEDMPPLLTAGVRFLVAGVIVALVLAVRHGPSMLRVRPIELRGAAVVGVLLLAGGNGGVVLGERTVPSGLAALLIATIPLWVVLLRGVTGDWPRTLTWVGVLLGLVGLIVLVVPGERSGGDAGGIAFLLGAATCWTFGSFMSQRMAMPANPFVASVWEMLLGGATLIAVALLRGERAGSVSSYSAESLFALAYLVIFGSIVAYTAYIWLLQNATLSLVATYACVNPVVAVLLGAAILGESITVAVLVGGAIVVAGVAVVIFAERPESAPAPAPDTKP